MNKLTDKINGQWVIRKANLQFSSATNNYEYHKCVLLNYQRINKDCTSRFYKMMCDTYTQTN